MREPLPDRRQCSRFEMEHGGILYVVTLGEYPDGRIGDIFLYGGKSGTDIEASARDNAVLASLCIQYGVPIEVIQKALTRIDDKTPAGAMGKVFDIVSGG